MGEVIQIAKETIEGLQEALDGERLPHAGDAGALLERAAADIRHLRERQTSYTRAWEKVTRHLGLTVEHGWKPVVEAIDARDVGPKARALLLELLRRGELSPARPEALEPWAIADMLGERFTELIAKVRALGETVQEVRAALGLERAVLTVEDPKPSGAPRWRAHPALVETADKVRGVAILAETWKVSYNEILAALDEAAPGEAEPCARVRLLAAERQGNAERFRKAVGEREEARKVAESMQERLLALAPALEDAQRYQADLTAALRRVDDFLDAEGVVGHDVLVERLAMFRDELKTEPRTREPTTWRDRYQSLTRTRDEALRDLNATLRALGVRGAPSGHIVEAARSVRRLAEALVAARRKEEAERAPAADLPSTTRQAIQFLRFLVELLETGSLREGRSGGFFADREQTLRVQIDGLLERFGDEEEDSESIQDLVLSLAFLEVEVGEKERWYQPEPVEPPPTRKPELITVLTRCTSALSLAAHDQCVLKPGHTGTHTNGSRWWRGTGAGGVLARPEEAGGPTLVDDRCPFALGGIRCDLRHGHHGPCTAAGSADPRSPSRCSHVLDGERCERPEGHAGGHHVTVGLRDAESPGFEVSLEGLAAGEAAARARGEPPSPPGGWSSPEERARALESRVAQGVAGVLRAAAPADGKTPGDG